MANNFTIEDVGHTNVVLKTTETGGVHTLVVDPSGGASGTNVAGVLSPENSSTANLAPAGVFTGTGVDVLSYGSINVYVYSSHASATNGLSLQQSNDNVNWFITDTFTVAATAAKVIHVPRQARYFRLVYTNGGTLTTTLIIQTILNAAVTRVTSQRPGDGIGIENDYDMVINAALLYNGTSLDLLRSAIATLNSAGTGIMASGLVAKFDDVSPQAVTENSMGVARMSNDGILMASVSPTSNVGSGIVSSVTAAAGGSVIAKASAGNLYGINIVAGASAGFLMIFNSTTVPADGAVTPIKCLPIAANAGFSVTFNPPIRLGTGIVAVFSTTGPFTKTISATAFISVDYL